MTKLKFLFALTLALVPMSFTGCGGDTTTPTTTEEEAPADDTGAEAEAAEDPAE